MKGELRTEARINKEYRMIVSKCLSCADEYQRRVESMLLYEQHFRKINLVVT